MKTKEQIEAKRNEIANDERLGYPTATIETNAPLALIQMGFEAQLQILNWILGDF